MSGVNKITATVAQETLFPDATALHGSSTTYNQGDLLVLDTSTHLIKVQALEADSAKFLGVAPETVVNGKLPAVYATDVDASAARTALPGPVKGVRLKVVLKTGDSLNPGDKVGLDPATLPVGRGVTATIVTESIGVYGGPAISSAAAGTEIEIYLPKFGSALLS